MATTNTEREMNGKNRDDWTELNNNNDRYREPNFDRMRKCKQCHKYTYGHTPPYGSNYTIEKKQDEKREKEISATLEKRRRLKEKKDKEDNLDQKN